MVNTIESDYSVTIEPRIVVVGVGGAGCNVVSSIYKACSSVDTIAINTDKNALLDSSADKKIFICKTVTKGEGTRGDARLGKKCAQVHEDEIRDAISGHDAVFIVAGLGGGTGTGAAAVIADICNTLNVMTFVIAINPFSFEGSRVEVAAQGLRSIRAVCPYVFPVENELVLNQIPDVTINEAFDAVNRSIKATIDDMIDAIPVEMEDQIRKIHSSKSIKEKTEMDSKYREYGLGGILAYYGMRI